MTAMDSLNRARAAWERSQPQLFLDVDPVDRGSRLLSGGSGFGTGTLDEPCQRPSPYLSPRTGGAQPSSTERNSR